MAGLVGLAAFAAGAASGADAPTRIGVIDMDKAVENLQVWQEAQVRLHEAERKAETTLADQKKEMDRVEAEMEYFKAGTVDYERRRAELSARRQKAVQLGEELSRALATQAKSAREEAEKQIRGCVREVAIARGLDAVVDARAVYYAAAGSDITLDVAREANKRYKSEKPPDRPAPPKEE